MKSKPLWFSCWSPMNEGICGMASYDNKLFNSIVYFIRKPIRTEEVYYGLRGVLSGLSKSDDVH